MRPRPGSPRSPCSRSSTTCSASTGWPADVAPTTATVTDTVTDTAPLRTGWEPDTPSADTLALACLRAMAHRAADWAQAAGGTVRRAPGLVLADALSPCPFLNVAAVAPAPDVDAAR